MRNPNWLLFLCLLFAGCGPRPASQLVIEEHLLTGPPDISTDQLLFDLADAKQYKDLERTAPYKNTDRQVNAHNQRILENFGYELKTFQKPDSGATHDYVEIYKGGQLIAGDIVSMRPLYQNAEQTQFIGMVDKSDGTYLFTRDLFEARQWAVGRQPYAYVGDRLLSVELNHLSDVVSEIHVYLDEEQVYRSEFNNVSTYISYDDPWAYDGHWVLALLDAVSDGQGGWKPVDRLVQDGQDLNTSLGYQQSFQFSLLDGRPFYFYQKDGKVDLSFDGRQIPKGYDEVPHYACCTESLLNPGHSMNMVWFFARSGTDWYYVEAYVPAAP